MAEKSVFSYKGTVLPIVLRALTFATTSQLGCKCWADLFCCKSACLLIWAEKKYLESWNYFFIPPIWLASFMLKFFFLHDIEKILVKSFVFSYIQPCKINHALYWHLDEKSWFAYFYTRSNSWQKKTATQLFSSKYFSEENSHFHTPAN